VDNIRRSRQPDERKKEYIRPGICKLHRLYYGIGYLQFSMYLQASSVILATWLSDIFSGYMACNVRPKVVPWKTAQPLLFLFHCTSFANKLRPKQSSGRNLLDCTHCLSGALRGCLPQFWQIVRLGQALRQTKYCLFLKSMGFCVWHSACLSTGWSL